MSIKGPRQASERQERSVIYRLSGGPQKSTLCVFWLAGRCNKKPCRFVHSEKPFDATKYSIQRNSPTLYEGRSRENPKCTLRPGTKGVSCDDTFVHKPESKGTYKPGSNTYQRPGSNTSLSHSSDTSQKPKTKDTSGTKGVSCDDTFVHKPESKGTYKPGSNTYQRPGGNTSLSHSSDTSQKPKAKDTSDSLERVCRYWLLEDCVKGNQCQYLHSWFHGKDFSMLAKLEGHKKAITGIALPAGSDKLYSGSTDGTTRIWDCNTGQCTHVTNVGGEVGSLISEGPWVFVGLPNAIKAWNIHSSAEFCLEGPVGQVYAMIVANEMLFAGVQDGSILAWKGCSEANPFKSAASLKGHSLAVLALAVGGTRLYSGSMDKTIRVWDLETLHCLLTLNEHNDAVMSIICWDQYLLSCSLDQTIKVWFATEGGNLEVAYTRDEEYGVLALCGMTDADGKPILFCSLNDNLVRMYELPSFCERGQLYAKKEVRSLQVGPGGLFFSGDYTGALTVWKWLAEPVVLSCS